MDTDTKIHSDNICCACLCEDDNLVDLKNSFLMDVFSSIINVNPLDSSSDIKYLSCWRCRGLLGKYNKFIKQVNQSYTLLSNYSKKKLELIDIKKIPTISTYKQYNIDISQSLEHHPFKVKTEEEETIVEKNEPEDNSASELDENNTEDMIEIEAKHANDLIETAEVKPERKKQIIDKNQSIIIDQTKKKKKKKDLWLAITITDEQIKEECRKLRLKSMYVDALFKCEGCLEVFANCDDYEQHLKIRHDESRAYKCVICTRTFNNMAVLNQHLNKHRSRYVCVVCDNTFNTPRQVLKHREMEHYDTSVGVGGHNATPNPSTSPLTCEICNKTFIWKSSLRKHMEKHTIEAGYKRKPYCETCRMSFTSSASLQKHIKTSSKHEIKLKLRNIKGNEVCVVKKTKLIEQTVNDLRATFACRLCDKQFQWRGNLYRHMSSHEAKAKGHLNCVPCNRTFSSVATYQQHMKLSKKHVTETEYKFDCADCGKKFMSKTKLSDHINWEHLKKYAHKCSFCDKIFKSYTSLYIHKQAVHKTGKEHLCENCGRSFPNACKLRSHVNALHNRTSLYKCSICNASFNWQSCLSRHRRIVHKEDTTKQCDK